MQVMFRLHVVHINMAAAFPRLQRAELEQHAERIVAHLSKRHGADKVISLRIEDVCTDVCNASARVDALQNLLSSVKDGTSRQDILAQLRHKLLQRMACELGCNKLLLGDSASQLAASFLAALSKVRFALRCTGRTFRI